MLSRFSLAALAVLAVVAAHSSTVFGCDHCGCVDACQKTCRLVCETKKVEITCWGCKCEDFCVPGPSKLCSQHCEMVCEECDKTPDAKGVCYQPHKFVWNEWIPGCCAKIHTRKKLMKKTITKTIPSYKWVVENLCPNCQAHAQSVAVPPGTELPQLPVVAAMTVKPVGTLPPSAIAQVSAELEEDELYSVQPAAMHAAPPLPTPRAVPAPVPVAAPPAPKSWSDSVRGLWLR
ncbi:hypothetical protein [Anatilimnocola floriformis]|uniref:hypothetical protein n=1 Tax=Anatilimnocola floriformis TaxID=2948575 RepID=UPI0020C31F1B|nr:hypothetical protein [Anatilimnocola floriformis]